MSIDQTVAVSGHESQEASPARRPVPWRPAAAWAAGWGSLLLLALWTARLSLPLLAAAALCALAWTALDRGAGPRWRAAVALALGVTVALAGRTQWRLWEVGHRWGEVSEAVVERAGARVNEGLDRLFDRGGRAVLGAAEVAGGARRASAGLFHEIERVRRETGMTALAIYGPDGFPVVWAGEHRGTVPDSVRRGLVESSYSAGPLFGYIYFAEPLQTGNVAVAAKLLEAHVRVGEGATPYADRFAERNGMVPHFTTPALAQGEDIWDWATASDTILSGVFETLSQEGWRARVIGKGREEVLQALGIAAILLALAWYRGGRRNPGIPVAVLTAGVLLLPLAETADAGGLFSPVGFVLPLPVDVPLGQLLILLTGVSVWLLARQRAGRFLGRLPLLLRIPLAAGALTGALWLVRTSVAASVLAQREGGGAVLGIALTLLAALPLYLLFGHKGRGSVDTRWVMAGFAVALAMGMGMGVWWRPGRELPVWIAAAWAVPFALAALGIPRGEVRRGALLPWATVAWVSATLALPALWTLHLDERLHDSERQLARLGTQADPFLDYLLRQFAEDVLRLDAEGRQGVSLLYQAWVEAGLAREGYEGRITLWNGPVPVTELRLADAALPQDRLAALIALARRDEEPKLERLTTVQGVHYLLVVPLAGGQNVSVAVPPRAYLGRSTSLARFLDPGDASEAPYAPTLSLVPAPRGAGEPGGRIRWVPAGSGWRSETTVAFPNARIHAHLLVPTPARGILFARGAVGLVLLVAALVALWALARTLCGEPLGVEPARWLWLASFRGRLTVVLFVFFLLPMSAFGATAYQALSREVERTAAALADRALTQASGEASGRTLGELARHVEADLLRYDQGVLDQAAVPEVIDLGLYHAWLPPSVYLDLALGDGMERVEHRELAGHDYLVAYRRLGPRQVLASPTPLATGEIARRRRELADLVALAGLAGAALSIVLSLFVARAFSRPIEALSGAASAVGSGDLAVRLPSGRRDEFGPVYRAFNRMVRGLRQTQAALVRETRRTEAIVAEAGTGVIALDANGRVALINPRAEQVLGTAVAVGSRLPADHALAAHVAETVGAFLASGDPERVDEREVEGRVIRLRMRRLSVDQARRGAVLVLEDVTNEIRSARVLAWGEMARQVAHEIKNPLTPIKLAVQHLRRAYADGRDDFGVILDRNVGSILQEIDHLGEISRAFARFGTPAEAGAPLERVDVHRVAEETLALYRGGRDGIDYPLDVDPAVPRVNARPGELKEVLVNLLENARAALDGAGEVRIAASVTGGGTWLQVDVTDTGEGIPPESLPRVFEPQFSTRSSGTGLGLAIVKRLVESWGGELTVDSVVGEGTTVHLRLRVADDPVA